MTNKNKQVLIDLSKKFISELTSELNNEIKKVKINLSEDEKNNIIVNCDGILAKLNSRLSQLKKVLSP